MEGWVGWGRCVSPTSYARAIRIRSKEQKAVTLNPETLNPKLKTIFLEVNSNVQEARLNPDGPRSDGAQTISLETPEV